MSKAIKACEKGKLSTLKEIVSKNPLVINQYNRDGYTCLSIAILYQQFEIIDYLLDLDILDVNAGNNGISPIFIALNTDNQDIALKLVHFGANPNTLFPDGTSIIHYCIQSNYKRLIHKLFEITSFDYKIVTNDNENVLHVIQDNDLFIQIVQLIKDRDNQCIPSMINALNKQRMTPLWKAIKQNQYELAISILDPNIGNANINYICADNQSVAHLIYTLYSSNSNQEEHFKFHQLLTKYNADLSIVDDNGYTPIDIEKSIEIKKTEKESKQNDEEQLLLQETMKMREKLKNCRIIQKKKKPKLDKYLNIWLNSHELNATSFSSSLLSRKISWNQFMNLNDDEIYEIIQNDCNDMNDDIIQYLLIQWNASKMEYQENQKIKNEEKERKINKKKQKEQQEIIEEKDDYKEPKLECNKYVKYFLSDYRLLELEFIFAKEQIDMTKLSEINNIWIEKHIVGNSNHANNLKMKLKLAIRQLRKDIVSEMKLKIKKDYEEKYGDKMKNKMLRKYNRKNLRKNLKKIHPFLLRIEEVLSDPIYLLLFGFVIFVIFTFVLFVIVGPVQEKKSSLN